LASDPEGEEDWIFHFLASDLEENEDIIPSSDGSGANSVE